MSVLKIRNDKGDIVDVLALKGEKGDPGAGMELENNSVVFNDYVNNEVLAKYSAIFGTNNTAGYKGYPISSLVLAEDKLSATVTLADKDFFSLYSEHPAHMYYAVNDIVQLEIDSHWYNSFVITDKTSTEDGNTVFTIAYPTGEEILKSMALASNQSENWLWVVDKQVGLPIGVQKGIAVFGDNNVGAGRGAAVFGRNNKVIGDYSGAVGRDNVVGYAGFGCGWKNKVGHTAFAANYNNIASGTYAASFGELNQSTGQRAFTEGLRCNATAPNAHAGGVVCTARHQGAFVFGACLKSAADYQALFGKFAVVSPEMLFAIGNGEEDSYSTAFSVFVDGHAEVVTQGETDNSIVTIKHLNEVIATLTAEIESLKSQLNAQKEE